MRYGYTTRMTFLAAAVTTLLAASANAQQSRQARIVGEPNLNGIWQAVNSANWNLEAHSAQALEGFWQLGAIGAIPAGQSVIDGDGKIPYRPEALAQRDENRAGWPAADPETMCFLPGIPRATYMPHAFQIIQSGGGHDLLFVYEYASANREVFMSNHKEPPVDTWMGWSNGRWDGDTLVVETTGLNGMTWLDRAGNYAPAGLKVTERFTLMGENHMQYQATLEEPNTYTRAWTISMPLYRRLEPNAQLLEFKCVPFVEELRYKDLELPEDSE